MINEMSLKIIHFLQPLLSSFYCAKDVYNLHIGRPCLIALFFLMPFLEIEGCGNPIGAIISNSIHSLGVCVSQFCHSHNISNFSLLYLLWCSMISDL